MQEEPITIDLVRHFLPKSSTQKSQKTRQQPTYLETFKKCSHFPASINTISGKKWGYISQKGKLVIPAQFDLADDFQENGLAIVTKNGKTGLIFCSGRFLLAPRYQSILPFTEGLAIVITNNGFKVINETGKELTEKAYSFIAPYEEGRAVFANTSSDGNYLYGYLDRKGQEIIPLQYEYATDFKDGNAIVRKQNQSYALINQEGTVLQTYPFQLMSGFNEGLSAFKKSFNEPFGYVNEQGVIVISPRFSIAQPFQNGKAVVSLVDDTYNRYGLIDQKGNFVIPAKYNDIIQLGEGLVALGKAIEVTKPYVGSVYAIASTSGHLLTDFIYNSVSPYKEGLSSVTNGQSTFFINKSGKAAKNFPIFEGNGTLSLENGLIKAFIDQRVMYFDQTGKLVWKPNTVIPLNKNYKVREVKFSPNKDYLVYYPQVEGIKNQKEVNQILKEKSKVKDVPNNVQLDYSYTGEFSIEFNQKNLLVLKLSAYEFPFGAAHGMPSQEFVHINIETGEIYELKDLFKQEADYVKVLSDIIEKQIAEQQKEFSYFFPEAFKEIKADQPFFITKDALAIYFSPYEIAAYAAGFPTFKIPYKDIIDMIDTNGSLWLAFH